jgi:outer membrane lipase/esterase
MKKQILAFAFSCLSTLFPLKASAQNFDSFYIFGDSLVDTGNLFRLTRTQIPPSPPYFNGRFSNGPIWVDVLGSQLGISTDATTNFGFGGATTGTFNALSPLVGFNLPGALSSQLNTFTTLPINPSSNALYVLWAGANDYLVLPPQLRATDATSAVNNLSNAVTALTAKGARNIIVVNLPDLGKTPQERVQPTAPSISTLVNSHNSKLTTALQELSQNRNLNIIPIDAYALLNEAIATPARYGLTNVTESCFNQTTGTLCSNPNQYLFWDGIHPTAAGHKIIAEFALAVLTSPQSVAPQGDIALGVARRQSENLDARLIALRNNREALTNQRVGVFINGDLNFGNQDNNINKPGYDFANTGVTAGIDYRLTNNATLGVAVGYTANNTNLNNNLGKIQVDSTGVSVYGSVVQNSFYADGVVSYGRNNFNITRKIAFDNRTATASPEGNQFSVAANTGYNIKTGNASFGPTVGVRYNRVDIDSYTEKDAGSLNMNVKDQKAESVVMSLGAEASYRIKAGDGAVIPYLRATYEHEFANDSREIVTEMASQPGIPMRVNTNNNSDRDYVKLRAGVQAIISENVSGTVDYQTILGRKDYNDQAVKAEIRYQF